METYSPFGAGGSTIVRPGTEKIINLITNPEGPWVILLTGIAGSGKSGVIRQCLKRLKKLDILHLALRIDQHLDCASTSTLGKAIIGREESPVLTPGQTHLN